MRKRKCSNGKTRSKVEAKRQPSFSRGIGSLATTTNPRCGTQVTKTRVAATSQVTKTRALTKSLRSPISGVVELKPRTTSSRRPSGYHINLASSEGSPRSPRSPRHCQPPRVISFSLHLTRTIHREWMHTALPLNLLGFTLVLRCLDLINLCLCMLFEAQWTLDPLECV